MIHLLKIVAIRVSRAGPGAGWLAVRCFSGRAKWSPESRILSVKADVFDDEGHEKWLEFLRSKPETFQMEVDYQSRTAANGVATGRFSNCREVTLELQSATLRPKGASTTRYYLKAIAEPGRGLEGASDY